MFPSTVVFQSANELRLTAVQIYFCQFFLVDEAFFVFLFGS